MKLEDLEVPDEAFIAVTGDHKSTAAMLKKRNKQECAGQESLFVTVINTHEDLDNWLAERTRALESMPEDSTAEVQAKAEAFQQVNSSSTYRKQQQLADLWTSAFFWKIEEPSGRNLEIVAPTHGQLNRLRSDSQTQNRLLDLVEKIKQSEGFFHWPLEFADATSQGGFDCVLGNPPWERIKLQEEEFFAARDPQIAAAPNKAARQRLIDQLTQTNPTLAEEFEAAKHTAECSSKFVRNSVRYPLTAVGDVNTYALFAEHFRNLTSAVGRAGVIVPTGIATDDTTKDFFGDLVDKRSLASLFDFENKEAIFPGVHRSYKFCLLTLSGAPVKQAQFIFFATRVEHLRDERRRFSLDPAEIALFNPNTRTMTIFRTKFDATLNQKIYSRIPPLVHDQKGINRWGVSYRQGLLHSANDVHLFGQNTFNNLQSRGGVFNGSTFVEGKNVYIPLYEAKMIWLYDYRSGSYKGITDRSNTHLPQTSYEEYNNPEYLPLPYYWVSKDEIDNRLRNWGPNWLLVFRDVTNSGNERTVVSTILPKYGLLDQFGLLFIDSNSMAALAACLIANLNSLVLDYIARQKINGLHLKKYSIYQLPIFPPEKYHKDSIIFISSRVLELIYTANDIKSFAEDLGYYGEPFSWNEARRAVIQSELDAYYAKLYGLNRDELRYILDPQDVYGPDYPGETFRVLKDKETRQYGEYRTRRLVLEAWDRLEGVEVGNPNGYSAKSAAVSQKQETILVPQPKSESRPAVVQTQLPAPAKPNSPVTPPAKVVKEIDPPAGQPTLTDFGLYKCEICGKMVMGFEKANHEREKHGGKGVEWKKVR